MLHINSSNKKHEWVTEKELQEKYVEVYQHLHKSRPHEAVGNTLRRNRMDKGITLRELARFGDTTPSHLSDVEVGYIEATDADLAIYDKMRKLLSEADN